MTTNARFLEGRESELSVLGAVFIDPSALDRIAGTLDAAHMHDPRHRLVYSAMLLMRSKGEPIDPMSVGATLNKQGVLARSGGLDYLLTLSEASASSINIKHHAKVVRDCADVRALCDAMGEVGQRANTGDYESVDDLISAAMDGASKVSAGRVGNRGVSLDASMTEALERIQSSYENKGTLHGVSTGFNALDEMLYGVEGGSLVVIAARPSMGKTAFMLNMATRMAKPAAEGEPSPMTVAMFSLEMPHVQLSTRILLCEAQIPNERAKSGHLTDGDIDRLLNSMNTLRRCVIEIDDTAGVAVPFIQQRCQALAADKSLPPLGAVFIDYLQLMRGKGANREQEVAGISRDLKALAKILDVPVFALAQLNRDCEKRADKRPMLSDLRESGGVEQDVDIAIFLYRDEYYDDESPKKGVAEVIVRKNRHGPVGSVDLTFRKEVGRFDDIVTNQY